MSSYLGRQLREIGSSKTLSWYGVALSFTHVLTAAFWWYGHGERAILFGSGPPVCWPQLPDCASFHPSSAATVFLLALFLAASLLAGFAFARARIRIAYTAFLTATALRFGIFAIDYRLMGNYHYLVFLASLIFLFVTGKRLALSVFLCLTYVAAGTLKLNAEWMSGAALHGAEPVHGPLLTFLLGYTVVLELGIAWLLLSSSRWSRRFAFANLLLFHLFSWQIVGFFFPTTMLALLLIFPLAWRFEAEEDETPELWRGRAPRGVYATAAVFCALQLPPWLQSPDAAITGEGRIFAENMFDAFARCEAFSFARYRDRWEEVNLNQSHAGIRVKCDPIVFWNTARHECELRSRNKEFRGLSVQVYSRRASDPEFHRIIHEENFCEPSLSYSVWHHNPWIRFEPAEPIYRSAGMRAGGSAVTSEYRGGPGRQGTGPEVPPRIRETWRALNGNVGIHTASKSSPAVDSSGVYVGGDASEFLSYGLDGHENWRFILDRAEFGIHGTAALDGDSAYIGAYNGRLYKLRKSDGQPEWVVQLGQALGASPLLSGEFVYASVELGPPANGFVVKLDRATGREIWRSPMLGNHPHSSPALSSALGLIFLGANNGKFFALDEATGAVKWAFSSEAPVKSTPALIGASVVFTSWDGYLYSLRAKDGTLKWKARIGKSQSSPTWIPGTNVLVAGSFGAITGVDLRNGQVLWRRPVPGYSVLGSGLGMSGGGGTVWITCARRSLCELDAAGTELRQVPLDAELTGVPASFGGSLYLSENGPGYLVRLGPPPLHAGPTGNAPATFAGTAR
jgi:outer membrane protein assembly factor BamB